MTLAGFFLPLLIASSPGASGSIAILIEGSSGTAGLATALEQHLGAADLDVRTDAETRAAARFLELESPLTDTGCTELRSELGVDRLLILSSRATTQGIALQLRLAKADVVDRTFVLSSADGVHDEARKLVDAALAAGSSKSPAGGRGVVGKARVHVGDTALPTWRTIPLSPPSLDETLIGSEIEVRQKTKGTFHAGLVVVASAERLVLADKNGLQTDLVADDLDRFALIRPGRPLVSAGDDVVLVSRSGERIEGTVVDGHGDSVRLAFKNGTSGRVRWSQVASLEVRARHLDAIDVKSIDIESIGITPMGIHQPKPRYPRQAWLANLTGKVVLQIIVDKLGKVSSIKVVSGEPIFVAPAIAAVSKWRYQPVVVNGESIVWKSKVSLTFKLE